MQCIPVLTTIFQSTLPRGERPTAQPSGSFISDISIHAPTRGATKTPIEIALGVDISIHAPTRGATNSPVSNKIFDIFQSTLPRGERRCRERFKEWAEQISIHAPTRGATRLKAGGVRKWKDFNPRSHEGSDKEIIQVLTLTCNFNPRSHEGSDDNSIVSDRG